MTNKSIESVVVGKIHGNDASAGFANGWVEMIDMNQQVMAPRTEEAMNSIIDQFTRGNSNFVFRGDYTGVNPNNPSDTINLKTVYTENENTSYPLFNYILTDIITIEEIK